MDSTDDGSKKRGISFGIHSIQEILLRLKIKAILKLRSLSKPVEGLIKEPYFVNKQLLRAKQEEGLRESILVSENNSVWVRLFAGDKSFDLPKTNLEDPHNLSIIGITNGLVCLSYWNNREIYIINPVLGICHRVQEKFQLKNVKKDLDFLGFRTSQESGHRLFRVLYRCLEEGTSEVRGEAYDASDSLWRVIDVGKGAVMSPNYVYLRSGTSVQGMAVDIEGVLYWQVIRWSECRTEYSGAYVASFDTSSYKFEIISWPVNLTQTAIVKQDPWNLVSYKGQLAQPIVASDNFQIWLYEPSLKSWTMKFTVTGFVTTGWDVGLVGCSTNGKLVIQQYNRFDRLTLVSYDPVSEETEILPFKGTSANNFYLFSGSLVNRDLKDSYDKK